MRVPSPKPPVPDVLSKRNAGRLDCARSWSVLRWLALDATGVCEAGEADCGCVDAVAFGEPASGVDADFVGAMAAPIRVVGEPASPLLLMTSPGPPAPVARPRPPARGFDASSTLPLPRPPPAAPRPLPRRPRSPLG